MIPIEKLKQIETIVTHKGCPDGIASAMILHDCLPSAEIVFLHYNSLEHIGLEPTPGMLFCDFTPHPSRVQEFIDAGTIVLDHHRGAKDLVKSFGEMGIFADEDDDPGVSGAMLAYDIHQSLTRDLMVSSPTHARLAALVGIRDTWQVKDPAWNLACKLSLALKFWPVGQLLAAKPAKWDSMLEIGSILAENNREHDKRTLAQAYWFESRFGLVCCFQGGSRDVSDISEQLGNRASIVISFGCFVEDGEQMIGLSLRSRGALDVSVIARHFRGNGHVNAAGCKVAARGRTPWLAIEHVLAYEEE